MKVLILGINGFVGHRLTETILSKTDWDVYGMDLYIHRLSHCLRYPRLHFHQGDITKEFGWLKKHIAMCDVILPLAAMAEPEDSQRAVAIDFEINLPIIRLTLAANKRLIFPSLSKIYDLYTEVDKDAELPIFNFDSINNTHWSYSASKHLLDRIIYTYGKREGLKFTLYKPFNWIGPNQNDVFVSQTEKLPVVSHFIRNIIHSKNLTLINGGRQKKCFTYINDAIDALLAIIENKNNVADQRIFNIGNPNNNISIKDLALKIKALAVTYPKYQVQAENTEIIVLDEEKTEEYFDQTPSILSTNKYLNWHPKIDIDVALKNILDFYLS